MHVENDSPAIRRILNPDGTIVAGRTPSLCDEDAVEAFRAMLLSRAFDQRCFSLQRQGRIGTFSTVEGEEAAVVGSVFALESGRDWVVPQYRELPAMLRMGYSLTCFLRYFIGDPAGNRMPDGANVLPFQISLAAQLPHAVGLAWGLRHQSSDAVVMAYFGDGASSVGDAHEAMNLAGIRHAPVVFVLKNNGWAISTPVTLQTAAGTFAARAEGYGFPGVLVDGNDLYAVHEACAEAVARARAGEGPTLIEARTWRLGPHNTADDPTRYVDATELELRRAADPIARMRAHLRERGLVDEQAEADMVEEVHAEIEAAVAEAEGGPRPGPAQLFEHVYADPPERVRRQRDEAVSCRS
ncbi:MAG: pyruvate dehydrogenase component alpha subunit [Solirubrobacteraceae bacterium]